MAPPRRELRVGDRERDLVTFALQEALAEGRITLDELDTLLDRVLRARTLVTWTSSSPTYRSNRPRPLSTSPGSGSS